MHYRIALVLALIAGCGGDPSAPAAHDAGTATGDAGVVPRPPEPPADAIELDEAPQVDRLPPIAGGSLLVTPDRIVAGDPDHATIWVLDPDTPRVVERLVVGPADEPGRMVADGDAIAHVVLRGSGEVLDLDPRDGALLRRRAVCAAPRGIDWDPGRGLLLVACAGGELMGLPPAGGEPRLLTRLEPDLRDVVVGDGVVYVSRFRSAELIDLDPDTYEVWRTRRPHPRTIGSGSRVIPMAAVVAWRLRRLPAGGVAMLHQRARTGTVEVERSGYAGGAECDIGITAPAISRFTSGAEEVCVPVTNGQPCVDGTFVGGGPLSNVSLAVDFAGSPSGDLAYLAVAESAAAGATRADPTPFVYVAELDTNCVRLFEGGRTSPHPAIAIEALADGARVTVHRDPFEVSVEGGARFRGLALEDGLGHDLFHAATASRVACASCHPEGHEDGHVWRLGAGPRRTQSVLGGVLSTAPFHWSGDMPDLAEIMQVSFVERMRGRPLEPAEVDAVGQWLDAQPDLPGSAVDTVAEARGRALFEDPTTGCADCHADRPRADSVDVGTGGFFQVPRLAAIALRAPYLHDGCAATLEEVLVGDCSPPDAHGVTSHLDEAGRADLVAYLRSR